MIDDDDGRRLELPCCGNAGWRHWGQTGLDLLADGKRGAPPGSWRSPAPTFEPRRHQCSTMYSTLGSRDKTLIGGHGGEQNRTKEERMIDKKEVEPMTAPCRCYLALHFYIESTVGETRPPRCRPAVRVAIIATLRVSERERKRGTGQRGPGSSSARRALVQCAKIGCRLGYSGTTGRQKARDPCQLSRVL